MVSDLVPLLREYASGLWARRWSIIVTTWALSLIGWAVVALLPNVYSARSQIYVDSQSIIGPLMRNLTVMPDTDSQIQMMRQTLLSRPNLEDLIEQTGLGRGVGVGDTLAYEDLLKRLARDIEVRQVNASLFEIGYHAPDPEIAYGVVRAVIDLFVERNLGLTRRDVDAAQAFIDRQIGDYEAKLRSADLALARFKSEHAAELGGTDRVQRELEDARSAKRTLESERGSASWQREQLRLQLASTPMRLPRAEAIRAPTRAEARLTELQTQLDQSLLVFTELHPSVAGLKRLVGQAEEEVARERGGSRADPAVANPMFTQLQEQLRGLDLRIADLDRRTRLVSEDIDRLSIKVAESPEVEADLLRLTRDYEALSKNYQELVQRRETAHLAKQMDTETSGLEFRVVEPPVLPQLPSSPRRALLMLAVSAAALGVGFGIALLRIMLHQAVMRPGQLEQAFDLPVLGVVREVRMSRWHPFRAAEQVLAGSLLAVFFACSAGLIQQYRSNPLDPAPMAFAAGGKDWLEQRLAAVTASLQDIPVGSVVLGSE